MGQASPSGRTALQTDLKIENVEPFLQETGKRIEDYALKVQAIEIKSDAEAAAAGTFAREMAQTVESVERQRKEFVQPLNAHVTLINSRFKGISNPLQTLVNGVKAKLKSYQDAKERKALEAQETERKRLAKLDEQRAARAIKADKPVPPPRPPPVAMPVQTNYGTTKTRKLWIFKVTDISSVPVEFLEVNGAKVRRKLADKKAEIEAGGQPVPGILFYPDTNIAV